MQLRITTLFIDRRNMDQHYETSYADNGKEFSPSDVDDNLKRDYMRRIGLLTLQDAKTNRSKLLHLQPIYVDLRRYSETCPFKSPKHNSMMSPFSPLSPLGRSYFTQSPQSALSMSQDENSETSEPTDQLIDTGADKSDRRENLPEIDLSSPLGKIISRMFSDTIGRKYPSIISDYEQYCRGEETRSLRNQISTPYFHRKHHRHRNLHRTHYLSQKQRRDKYRTLRRGLDIKSIEMSNLMKHCHVRIERLPMLETLMKMALSWLKTNPSVPRLITYQTSLKGLRSTPSHIIEQTPEPSSAPVTLIDLTESDDENSQTHTENLPATRETGPVDTPNLLRNNGSSSTCTSRSPDVDRKPSMVNCHMFERPLSPDSEYADDIFKSIMAASESNISTNPKGENQLTHHPPLTSEELKACFDWEVDSDDDPDNSPITHKSSSEFSHPLSDMVDSQSQPEYCKSPSFVDISWM